MTHDHIIELFLGAAAVCSIFMPAVSGRKALARPSPKTRLGSHLGPHTSSYPISQTHLQAKVDVYHLLREQLSLTAFDLQSAG